MSVRVPTRRILSTLITALVVATLSPALPASAEGPTVALGRIDKSVPGHVSGTVQATADHVRVRIIDTPSHGRLPAQVIAVDPETGVGSYDLESWGVSYARVEATVCGTATEDSCTGETVRSNKFRTEDIHPLISKSTKRLGPRTPTLSMTLDDARGGGVVAVWGEDCSGTTVLASDGTPTPIDTSDCTEGHNYFNAERCHSAALRWCRTLIRYGVPVDYVVDATLIPEKAAVAPDETSSPDLTVRLDTENDRRYTIDWRLLTPSGGSTGLGAHLTGVDSGYYRDIEISIDLSDLPDETYRLAIEMEDEESGATKSLREVPVRVDRVAPSAVPSPNHEVFYPVQDGYRDRIKVTLTEESETLAPQHLKVYDDTGDLVSSSGSGLSWDGRVAGRTLAPEGVYDLVAVVSDRAGNEARLEPVSVAVNHRHIETKSMSKRVKARRSLEDVWTGRCSQVERRVKGRPRGTIGLRSNATCHRNGWKGNGVVTVHSIKLPRAVKYRHGRLRLAGGAARDLRGSRAVLEWWNTGEQAWDRGKMMPAQWRPDHHARGVHDVPGYQSGRRLYWRVLTGDGAGYDVAAFRYEMVYEVLRY